MSVAMAPDVGCWFSPSSSPARICALAKTPFRPLHSAIEPRRRDFSRASSPDSKAYFLCFHPYPKWRGFQLQEEPFNRVCHVPRARNADHHVAHLSTFDRLQSAVHDDVAHANVTADGDDVKINAQHIGTQMSCLGNESRNEGNEKELLPHGLQALFLPRHVAIIMDGNSRWAEEKGLHRNAGHEAGVDALKLIVRLSSQWGLTALTVFGFSTENWHRSQVEVSFLMELFLKVLKQEYPSFMRENAVIHFIGNIKQLPGPLQALISEVEHATSGNSGLKLTIALNYSGRSDIVQACQKLAKKVKLGKLRPEDITESDIEQELGTSWMEEMQNPDLLIRTSGELRISNFLLWQLAYTELYFMNEYWPDVNELHYANALRSYGSRNRRFGVRPSVDQKA